MIRNRYNYLTPSVQDTKKERRTHLKQRHHNQNTTSRKQKLAKRLSKIKISPDIHAKTYNDRNSKKGKRKVQGVPQSQAAAHPRHEEEEETERTKSSKVNPLFPNEVIAVNQSRSNPLKLSVKI